MERPNNSYYLLTSLFHQDGKGSVSWWLNSYKVNIMINICVAITRASSHATSHEICEFRIHSNFILDMLGSQCPNLIINSVYESLKCWSFGTFFFEVIQLLIRHFHHARNIPRKNSSKHTYKDPLLAWEFSTMAECNSFDSQISYQIIFKWNIRQSQYRIGSLKIIQFSSNVKLYFIRPFHFCQQER